jgi:hypothetical protein
MVIATELSTSVFRLFGYGLMIVGGGTCIWMRLSHFKPLAGKKAFSIICCAVLLVTAAIKVVSDPQPQSAVGSMAPPEAQVAIADAPTTKPAVADKAVVGSIWPDPRTGSQSLDSARLVAPKPVNDLADAYTDNANGFSIQFPTGWASKQFAAGDPWFVDCSDGKSGMISVGFSPFPSSVGIDQLKPAGIEAHLKAQKKTTLSGHGHATLDGHKGIWFRYTAPLNTATGWQMMRVVHYFVPLHDGRMLELRVASTPDQFHALTPLLRKSMASIKVTPL